MHSGFITEHFSWYEVEHSETAEREGIDNTVPVELMMIALITAKRMEAVRALFQHQIKVTSWYRCPSLQELPQFLNPKSQHPKCEAVDFVIPNFGSPIDVARRLTAEVKIIDFDQLILEYTWVHISWGASPGYKQRNEVLTLLNTKVYAPGLTDKFGRPI